MEEAILKAVRIKNRTLEDAKEILGDWPWRVVHEDGKDFIITMDYCAGRLNLRIENGVIVKVTFG